MSRTTVFFVVLHSAKLYEKWIMFGCGRMHFLASIGIGANVKFVESFLFWRWQCTCTLRILAAWKSIAIVSAEVRRFVFSITTDTKKEKCLWLILRAIFVSAQRAVIILFNIHAFWRMLRFFDVSINLKLQPFFDGLFGNMEKKPRGWEWKSKIHSNLLSECSELRFAALWKTFWPCLVALN